MSDRTEQLILRLTPEEKARIERLAHAEQQTPEEYLLDLFHRQDDDEDDEVIDIEANIRQAVREVDEGKTTPITSVWDILDRPDEQ